MKKLLTLTALLATASLSFGQGFVAFANTSTTRISTNGVLQVASAVSGTWYYALLVAPSTQNTINASLAGWTFVGYGTNTALAGRMSGNSSADSSAIQIPGFGTTATADFAIVGWSGNLGPDYASVIQWYNGGTGLGDGPDAGRAGFFGISTVANDIPLAPSGGPYNGVWGSTVSGQIQGLNLTGPIPAPEPTSFALAGLGAAAMMIFRRRK